MRGENEQQEQEQNPVQDELEARFIEQAKKLIEFRDSVIARIELLDPGLNPDNLPPDLRELYLAVKNFRFEDLREALAAAPTDPNESSEVPWNELYARRGNRVDEHPRRPISSSNRIKSPRLLLSNPSFPPTYEDGQILQYDERLVAYTPADTSGSEKIVLSEEERFREERNRAARRAMPPPPFPPPTPLNNGSYRPYSHRLFSDESPDSPAFVSDAEMANNYSNSGNGNNESRYVPPTYGSVAQERELLTNSYASYDGNRPAPIPPLYDFQGFVNVPNPPGSSPNATFMFPLRPREDPPARTPPPPPAQVPGRRRPRPYDSFEAPPYGDGDKDNDNNNDKPE